MSVSILVNDANLLNSTNVGHRIQMRQLWCCGGGATGEMHPRVGGILQL